MKIVYEIFAKQYDSNIEIKYISDVDSIFEHANYVINRFSKKVTRYKLFEDLGNFYNVYGENDAHIGYIEIKSILLIGNKKFLMTEYK